MIGIDTQRSGESAAMPLTAWANQTTLLGSLACFDLTGGSCTLGLLQVCSQPCSASRSAHAGVFDMLTKAYTQYTKQDKAGVGVAVACGITSACLAQTVSFPLETIARRLQVSHHYIVQHCSLVLSAYSPQMCLPLATTKCS